MKEILSDDKELENFRTMHANLNLDDLRIKLQEQNVALLSHESFPASDEEKEGLEKLVNGDRKRIEVLNSIIAEKEGK